MRERFSTQVLSKGLDVLSSDLCRRRLGHAYTLVDVQSYKKSLSLRLRRARCTIFMLGGSSRTRSPLRAPLWSGTWLASALDRDSWRCVLTCASARSSLSIHRYLNCVPLCKSASRWQGLQRAPPSRNLPLRTPFFRLAGVPTSCSKCPGSGINLRWRNSRSLCDSRRLSDHPLPRPSWMMTPSGSFKHYFLAGFSVASQSHLRHLVGPGRFAFSSAPLPDLRTMVCIPAIRSCKPVSAALLLLTLLLSPNPNLALGPLSRLPPLPPPPSVLRAQVASLHYRPG